MRITWYGHACFFIEYMTNAGEPRRILTDPYKSPDCGGYGPVDERADYVTLSHENPIYHSDLSTIDVMREVVRGLELPEEGVSHEGVVFRSRRVFENDARDPDGANAMVRFNVEGMNVSHLGDLGHALNPDEVDFLRGTDVLLALAGGPPTLKVTDLKELVDELSVPLVLPMHYAVPGIRLNLRPVEDFTSLFPAEQVRRPGSPRMEVTKETLPDAPTVVVLEHLR